MDIQDKRKAALDVIYLASCAVNERIPDEDRVKEMDPDLLYQTARRHYLSAITAISLQSIGITTKDFTQAMGKAIRKAVTFDLEREAILKSLEEEEIWYMPLKGAVIKDMYPRIGMREMSDNDILCDPSRMKDVRRIMEERGYRTEKNFGRTYHDHYYKEPIWNFEMHRALFDTFSVKELAPYYEHVKERLLPDEGRSFGFHFSDEDFYIHMIAHEYKHYSNSGSGLRALLDIYVFQKKKGETLDWEYIQKELSKIGLSEFEEQNRDLAFYLFGEEDVREEGRRLSDEETKMLDYVVTSGTYGNLSINVQNHLKRYDDNWKGKARYVVDRIFLPMDRIRVSFPLFADCPILLPFLPFYRLIKGLIIHRKKIKNELSLLVHYKKESEPSQDDKPSE